MADMPLEVGKKRCQYKVVSLLTLTLSQAYYMQALARMSSPSSLRLQILRLVVALLLSSGDALIVIWRFQF